jgi:pimeloyl-ACP methyl ester carboxylesterase
VSDPQVATLAGGASIAFRHEQADDRRTGLFWLGGFRSDMAGTKAEALAAHARATSRPCLRFDYSGHGSSPAPFAEQTLSDWLEQSRHMFVALTKGPQVIVGSSMGGYLALLLHRLLRQKAPDEAARIKGLVLVAPAADMTEALLWAKLNDSARQTLLMTGETQMPSAYGESYPLSRALVEDGRNHLILADGLDVECPVVILQGDEDPDVPWQHAHKLFKSLRGADVAFTLVKGGDHRLSIPRDLALLIRTAEALCVRAES